MLNKPKKIVFIMTDTQRPDMLGCYGNKDLATPHLDRLAAEGMRFDRAYTCTPVCGPARSALFTGQYPHSNGSWTNGMPLGATTKTIGERLQDQGLHTAYIGKWHLDGGDYFGMGRCPAGWDPEYWYDMRCFLEELTEQERRDSRSFHAMKAKGVTAADTYAHRCSNRAIDFLSRHGHEDFLLVVSYDEPHGPCVCPEPYASMYEHYEFPKSPNLWDTLENKPEHQRIWAGDHLHVDKNDIKLRNPAYFGCHSFVDEEIGRVLEAVDRYAPDALVIYTSDHGDMMMSHSLEGKGPVMYEEITRVPFIVRWPGVVPAGSVCREPVSHIDVAPTILEAAGLPVPKVLEGSSLLPVLADPRAKVHDVIFMEFERFEIDHDGFGGYQPIRCAFDGRYKLVINLLTSDELYDLEADPYEMDNLIDSPAHAEIRNRLHDAILEWMNDTRDPFRGYYWECRPWRTDARPKTWDYTGMTRQREHEEYEPRQLDYSTGLPMTEAVRKK